MSRTGFSFEEVWDAYLDCRRRKRGTSSALRFEIDQVRQLLDLLDELNSRTYRPSRSVCFVNLRPKPREIFAADFRDRVVHHLFIRAIEEYWERVFIHDSYACRAGKGTHGAVDRVESFVRSATRGGRRRAWFLQVDVHNFFMSIDRGILFGLIDKGLRRQYGVPTGKLPLFCPALGRYHAMRDIATTLIFHDPTKQYVRRSPAAAWGRIPHHKTLFTCPENKGLPIGNLTSQFFGNVYLNMLDQFVKHQLKAECYVRYVDDAVLVHEDPQVLSGWKEEIRDFLAKSLLLRLNDDATRLRPVSCGINFLGYVVHPTHRLTRRRVAGSFEARVLEYRELLVSLDSMADVEAFRYDRDVLERLLGTLNSYMAHLAKADSHRLLSQVLDRHPWLSHYFRIEERKAERGWMPPGSLNSLAGQWLWFRQAWPDAVIFFEVGKYFELYGQDADWAHRVLRLARLRPRFCGVSRAGIPKRLASSFVEKTLLAGRSTLTAVESGYPSYGVVERLPATYWEAVRDGESPCVSPKRVLNGTREEER